MVSAWGSEQRLVLAQIAADAKSNEITAVPKLLEMLSLKGGIVTVDAPELPGRHRPADHRSGWRLCLCPQGQTGHVA
jgi:hypothetical protein